MGLGILEDRVMEHVPGRINIVCSLTFLLTLVKGRLGILTILKGHKLRERELLV
jgi:hypothetical protein